MRRTHSLAQSEQIQKRSAFEKLDVDSTQILKINKENKNMSE